MDNKTNKFHNYISVLLILFSTMTCQASANVLDIINVVLLAQGKSIPGGNPSANPYVKPYVAPPSHIYIPFPENIELINVIPMVGTTPAQPIIIDSTTISAVKNVFCKKDAQGKFVSSHEVQVSLSVSGTIATVTVIDSLTGKSLGKALTGTVPAGVTSFVVNYSMGGGGILAGKKTDIKSFAQANINQSLSIKSFKSIVVPPTTTYSMFELSTDSKSSGTKASISLPSSLITAINTAIAASHTVRFTFDLENSNLIAGVTDLTLGSSLGTASVAATSNTFNQYSLSYQTVDPSGVASPKTVQPLFANQAFMIFPTALKVNMPTAGGAMSSAAITYTMGSNSGKLVFDNESLINTALSNTHNVFLHLKAVPHSSTMQRIVASVYDSTTGSIITQKTIGKPVANGTTCSLTITPVITTNPAVTLSLGQSVLLFPVLPVNAQGKKVRSAASRPVIPAPTLSKLKAATTFSDFKLQIVAGSDGFLDQIDTSYGGVPSGILFQMAENTCGFGVVPYQQASKQKNSPKFSTYPWSTGVRLSVLAFDSSYNLIVDLTKSTSPSYIEIFVFDATTDYFIESVSLPPSMWAIYERFNQGAWNNNIGNCFIYGQPILGGTYPTVLNINVPAQSPASLKPLTISDLACIQTLPELKGLLLSNSNEQINPVTGNELGNFPGGISQHVPNQPNWVSFNRWMFFGEGMNGVSPCVDLTAVTQLMYWATGVTFVVLAFDQDGFYMNHQEATSTTPSALYLYCFDKVSQNLLGLLLMSIPAGQGGGSGALTDPCTWNITYGWPLTANYPAIVTFTDTEPANYGQSPSFSFDQILEISAMAFAGGTIGAVVLATDEKARSSLGVAPTISDTFAKGPGDPVAGAKIPMLVSILGSALCYKDFKTVMTGISTLPDAVAAGVAADFTQALGIQYPNALTFTFGNTQSFTIPVDGVLIGICSQVTDWTQGARFVILGYDSSNCLVDTFNEVNEVPAAFYVFVYDVATDARIGLIALSPSLITVGSGSWVNSANPTSCVVGTNGVAAVTSGGTVPTYPFSLIVTGPAITQPIKTVQVSL